MSAKQFYWCNFRGPFSSSFVGTQTHGHQPTGDELQENIALYADELKLVNVFEEDTDTAAFAAKVYADVLS